MTLRHLMPWKAAGSRDVTLLVAPGRRLAKLVTPTGTAGYGGAGLFRIDARRVDTIEDLAELLIELAGRADTCVLRGRLKAPVHPDSEVPCRIHDRDGDPARFEEVPRRWVMIDLEPETVPPYVDALDPTIVGGWLRGLLPAPFRSARCIVQLSGSAGLKPGARCHLWFMLDRALVKAELDRLLVGVAGLDPSTLRPRQLHYTASPFFVGVDDPCHERIALLPGYAEVEVGALPPPPRPRQAFTPTRAFTPTCAFTGAFTPTGGGAEAYANACLRRLAAAPEGRRHATCVATACRLLALAKAGVLDPARVASQIKGVMLGRGFDGRNGRDLSEIDSILQWAWTTVQPKGLHR